MLGIILGPRELLKDERDEDQATKDIYSTAEINAYKCMETTIYKELGGISQLLPVFILELREE